MRWRQSTDAIAHQVEEAERDDAFHRLAEKRWSEIAAGGATIAWDDTKMWLHARSRGEQPARPIARKLPR